MIEKDASWSSEQDGVFRRNVRGIAHEFEQPLNAIKMGSDFLSMRSSSGAKSSGGLHQVVAEMSGQVDGRPRSSTPAFFRRKADLVMEGDINKPIRRFFPGRRHSAENIRMELDLGQGSRHHGARQPPPTGVFQPGTNARIHHRKEGGCRRRPARSSSALQEGGSGGEVMTTASASRRGPDKIFEPFSAPRRQQHMGLGLAITYGSSKITGRHSAEEPGRHRYDLQTQLHRRISCPQVIINTQNEVTHGKILSSTMRNPR